MSRSESKHPQSEAKEEKLHGEDKSYKADAKRPSSRDSKAGSAINHVKSEQDGLSLDEKLKADHYALRRASSGRRLPTRRLSFERQGSKLWRTQHDVEESKRDLHHGESNEHKEEDSWESVHAQPSCLICKKVFSTKTKYDTHIKYSEVHALNLRDIEQARAQTNQVPQPKIIHSPKDISERCSELYAGAKFFWRTQDTVEIDIFLHHAQHCVEVVPYNIHTNKELNRLYFDDMSLIAHIGEDKIMTNLEMTKKRLNDDENNKDIPSDELLYAEEKRLLISTHLLSKLILENGKLIYNYIPLNDNAEDVNPLLEEMPSEVTPVKVHHRRLSSSQEFEEKINNVNKLNSEIEHIRKEAEHIEEMVEHSL